MKKELPKYTIEQLNQCDSFAKMNIDICRLEDHLKRAKNVKFPHRHDFYNLIYIEQGSGTHDIDFKSFKVQPKQLFFMNDGQVHEWSLSQDVKGYTFFFKKEFYNVAEPVYSLANLPFFHNGLNEAQMVIFDDYDSQVIENLFSDILHEFQKGQVHNEPIIKTILKIILIRSLRVYKPDFTANTNQQSISKIRRFEELIEQNFLIEKSVNYYAAQMNMSANYLNAICTKTIGKNAGQMIRDRVILEAKRLLIHSTLSICEMGYKLGYDDCSYYIRMFKKSVGNTPEQFRFNLT